MEKRVLNIMQHTCTRVTQHWTFQDESFGYIFAHCPREVIEEVLGEFFHTVTAAEFRRNEIFWKYVLSLFKQKSSFSDFNELGFFIATSHFNQVSLQMYRRHTELRVSSHCNDDTLRSYRRQTSLLYYQ